MDGNSPRDRYGRSVALGRRAVETIPEGASSNARGATAYEPSPMVFVDHADGATLTDVDGNEYIDVHAGASAVVLGHGDEHQSAVVRAQLDRGSYFGTPHEVEVDAAELLVDLVPAADMANFFSTGTEAVTNALRLARAYTGKEKILKFEGMYHGSLDDVLVNVHPGAESLGTRRSPTKIPAFPGVSTGAMEHVETLPWNDPALVEETLDREGDDVAAVVTEAVMGNGGLIWPEPGFLDSLQRLTADHDALFVLDEIVTGFRMGLGGAQGHFGLQPDLAVFGKAMANGYPCAAVTGRRDVMEFVGGSPESATFAGTFSGNPVATAAAKGALEALAAVGDSGYAAFRRTGERLTNGLREVFADAGEDAFVPDFAGFTQIHFVEGDADPESWTDWRDVEPTVDQSRYRSFATGMIDRGVFLPPAPDRLNLMHAHTDDHVDEVLDAAVGAAERLPE